MDKSFGPNSIECDKTNTSKRITMFITDLMHASHRAFYSPSFHLFSPRLRNGKAKTQIQQNTRQQGSTKTLL